MSIPRIDHRELRKLADPESMTEAECEAIRTAADRIEVLQDALFVLLQEAIPSGQNGPFMVTRDTMSKIAAVYSPGLEVLRQIAMKCEQNQPITAQDVDEAMAAMRRVQSGDQGGG